MINGQGIVPLSDRVTALNDSIHEVLVNRDWSSAFTKVGANGQFNNLRMGLCYYFPNGVNVNALPLTDEELEEVAGRHRVDLAVQFNSVPQRLVAAALQNAESIAIADSSQPLALQDSSQAQSQGSRPVGIPMPPRNPASSSVNTR